MNLLDEIKNSINSVIAERSVSPLFGSLVFTWLTWNWKIIYALFGQGEYLDFEDRLEFIEINYSHKTNLIIYPIISTIGVLLIYPLLSISAYWIWLKFDILKKKIRNNAEKNELLTLEESVKIRVELQKSKDIAANLILEKDREIEQLQKQLQIKISNLSQTTETKEKKKEVSLKETNSAKDKIKSNKKLTEALTVIFDFYKKGISFQVLKSNISDNTLEFFKTNKVIYEGLGGEIMLDDLGEEMYKDYLNNLFD